MKRDNINRQFLQWIKENDIVKLNNFCKEYVKVENEYIKNNWENSLNWKWLFSKLQKYDNGYAFNILGFLYLNGIYIEKDYDKAFEYFEKGVKKGNQYALNHLGWMYLNGIHVEINYEKAFRYYQENVKNGNIVALNNLGHMYYYGKFVRKNHRKAYEYIKKSAEGDIYIAMKNLEFLNSQPYWNRSRIRNMFF